MEDRLVCRHLADCDAPATYLMPQRNQKGGIGWLPVCWEHSDGWFADKEVIGEVLEVDLVSDQQTKEYLGIS